MPVEATIALAGRPPVIEPFDVNKAFLTLSQMKYLNANAQKVQAEAGLVQTQGAEALATLSAKQRVRARMQADSAPPGGTLASLGQPQAGGPPFDAATLGALPLGGSTPAMPETPAPGQPAAPPAAGPAPGGPAAAPARLSPYAQAQGLMEADPYEGFGPAKNVLDLAKQDLDIKKLQLDKADTALTLASKLWGTVTDQASHDRAREAMKAATGSYGQIPETYTPEATEQFRGMMRTAQQRVEEAQKDTQLQIDQHKAGSERLLAQAEAAKLGPLTTQAAAAAQDAASRERLAKRPYTLGTGYAQDHDVPAPKLVGPQAGAPGAPRSPEGLGQANALSSEFNAGTKVFGEATEAFNRLASTSKDKTNTSDRALLQAFVKLTDPGQVVGASFAKETAGLGTLRQQAESELNRLFRDDKGTMADDLRSNFVKTAKRIHAIQIDQHLQFRDEMRQKATDRGVPADEVAPNRLTTYGSGGKVLTQAKFKEILAGEQAKGKTRGEVLLDLAQKGYHVRGGPE
jgi:hypothetical protein